MQQVRSILLVGGGLANGLAALRLTTQRPEVQVRLLEAGPQLGGEHTWCWHNSDLAGETSWLTQLASASWDGYDVRFPKYQRTLAGGYHALRSSDFHRQLMEVLGDRVQTSTAVAEVHANHVVLGSGEQLHADCVVDGRGLFDADFAPCAYQKFHGLFIKTAEPHGLTRPLLMDATVSQLDGYRFLYLLPWSDRELLVEDTRYSDTADLDPVELRAEIVAYLARAGFGSYVITGDESGCLPLPLYGARSPKFKDGLLYAGMRAGLFHPTTGYSMPDAARFANWLVSNSGLGSAALARAASKRARSVWRRGDFCRRLNSMFFKAAAPAERRHVMAKFYERDPQLIARFYSGSLSFFDCLRLLSGPPPVPVADGARAFFLKTANTERGL